jgi:hypothetical protein
LCASSSDDSIYLRRHPGIEGRIGAMLPKDKCRTFEIVDFFARFLRSVTAETGVAAVVEATAAL